MEGQRLRCPYCRRKGHCILPIWKGILFRNEQRTAALPAGIYILNAAKRGEKFVMKKFVMKK
ncbi:hypothetical protein Barb7_01974 [Bacteroidales bacterium Barb7]|nr:hypothetical protein Barb7_01974 [Bacteroidales bacterium Barb7]